MQWHDYIILALASPAQSISMPLTPTTKCATLSTFSTSTLSLGSSLPSNIDSVDSGHVRSSKSSSTPTIHSDSLRAYTLPSQSSRKKFRESGYISESDSVLDNHANRRHTGDSLKSLASGNSCTSDETEAAHSVTAEQLIKQRNRLSSSNNMKNDITEEHKLDSDRKKPIDKSAMSPFRASQHSQVILQKDSSKEACSAPANKHSKNITHQKDLQDKGNL